MRPLIRVAGFAGSLRRASYNRALLRAALDFLPEEMQLEIIELDDLPLFCEDQEIDPPDAVLRFRQRLQQADAILIATPEYNYSISGVLKNAIDWASRPAGRGVLLNKPVAIMGCSTGRFGTVRAQLGLRQTLLSLNMPVVLKPEVAVANAEERFDAEGHLNDARTRHQLVELLLSLQTLVETIRQNEALTIISQ